LRKFFRPAIFATAFSLAACAGPATSIATPPAPFGAGALQRTITASLARPEVVRRPLHLASHLYVAMLPNVYRYKVTNGVPASSPDLEITTGGFGGPLAVGDRGDLYAFSSLDDNYVIGVFAPGATTPKRTIGVNPACGIYPQSLAVDGAGDVFFSYYFFYVIRERAGSGGCQGILVYGPHASGNAAPLQSIAIPGYDGNDQIPLFMTLDPSGNVVTDRIRSNDRGGVGEIIDPTTNPRLVRRFWSGGPDSVSSLAEAPGGGGTWARVAGTQFWRFSPSAHGHVTPLQKIEPTTGNGFDAQFAVDDTYLYAIDNATNTLQVYRTDKRGPQTPYASTKIGTSNTIYGVVAGP
jgi:hypothetical protein